MSLRLTMSWSRRASGTKTRPDVLKPGLECSPNVLLPTIVRQLVEMMKILIRLLNKMAPILVATLSGRHGYKCDDMSNKQMDAVKECGAFRFAATSGAWPAQFYFELFLNYMSKE